MRMVVRGSLWRGMGRWSGSGSVVSRAEAKGGSTVLEPFRIKMVDAVRPTTREERARLLHEAHYNPFLLHSADVAVDLLTDSGTGAMSARQWAAVMSADEAYAGSPAYEDLVTALHTFMPNLTHVFPVHQGRAAERVLARLLGGPGHIFPSNSHFDTTRANIEFTGATAIDLPCPEGLDTTSHSPFKGNMDLNRLRRLLEADADSIPIITLTATNNTLGGQPVSMANIRAVSALAAEFGKPFFIDSCRFAENAYFIKTREESFANTSILDIAREMFSLCNGTWNSAKKDGMANIGGFLAMDESMTGLADAARDVLVVTEGHPAYGGLAGRDLEAMAKGFFESMEESYLHYRVTGLQQLGSGLTAAGIPIILPVGGHAIFVDAARFLPHIPPLHFPGVVLANAMYVEGGIRGVEIGSLMFGAQPDGSEKPASLELTRLAFPRRVYTAAHMDLVRRTLVAVAAYASSLTGLRITRQLPRLRHFSAHFTPITHSLTASHMPSVT